MSFGAILFGLGSTVIGYSIWRGGSRTSSHIRGTATSKIATAAKGFAEVEGTASASAAGSLRDPITHQPCIWFAVDTEKFSFFDKCRWKTVKRARSSSGIVIDDGTGRCLVLPNEVEIDQRKEQTIVKDRWNLRHKVWWIREGDPVFAIGYLRRISDSPEDRVANGARLGPPPSANDANWAAEQALNLRATEILRSWKRDPRGKLAKFDTNKDGKLDAQEWEAVRAAAHAEAAGDAPAQQARGESDTVSESGAPERGVTHRLVKPPDGRPFLLTTHGEARLVSRSRSQAFWGLVFFVLGVITLLSLLRSCVEG